MKLVVISGSGRPDSQSAKVAQFLNNLSSECGFDNSLLYDLGSDPLPLWSPNFEKEKTPSGVSVPDIKKELASADAFLVVTPEWHGMATAIIKNFFLYFSGGSELSHKPALPVAVSAARGGAYPIAELRMSSYKNSHICYIPEHLIVRNVNDVMNDTNPQTEEDQYIQKRSEFALKLLSEYAKALQAVRKVDLNFSDYINGM